MRIGGSIFLKEREPGLWVDTHKKYGYTAAFWPFSASVDECTTRDYVNAAKKADIVIAEVGVWNNPLSSDDVKRRAAIKECQEMLDVADRIGASCCVNIAGSRGEQWDGPHPENFTRETFEMIVETVREIIDGVKPKQTFYTLEPMPWIYPDSPDSYLELVKAIDRKAFAVHLDPVNMISSPSRYFENTQLIRECFQKLGPYIKSCHAKDILLSGKLTVHLDEVVPGLGQLDYSTYLRELNKLDKNMPLMIEHLSEESEYLQAVKYISSVAKSIGAEII